MRATIMVTALAVLTTSVTAVALPTSNDAPPAECSDNLKKKCNEVFTQCMEKGHPYEYCKCSTANWPNIFDEHWVGASLQNRQR